MRQRPHFPHMPHMLTVYWRFQPWDKVSVRIKDIPMGNDLSLILYGENFNIIWKYNQ